MEASCLQTIFWVDLPCKSCQTCKFTVYDADRNVFQLRDIIKVITELWKESQGCCQSMYGRGNDSLRVVFPQGATKENKALLMAAALFIEFRFFSVETIKKINRIISDH